MPTLIRGPFEVEDGFTCEVYDDNHYVVYKYYDPEGAEFRSINYPKSPLFSEEDLESHWARRSEEESSQQLAGT